MTRKGSWALRFTAAALVGGVLALGAGGIAAAADPPAKATADFGEGLGIVVGNHSGAETNPITLKIGSDTEGAYCINFHSAPVTKQPEAYTESSWESAQIPAENLGKIRWILIHSFPSVSADSLLSAAGATVPAGAKSIHHKDVHAADIAYAGTQAAIWNFSDNLPLKPFDDVNDKSKVEKQDVYAAIQQVFDFLVKNAKVEAEVKPFLRIDPATASGEVGTKVGPFTVASSGGDIKLSATGGNLVDKDGKPVTALKTGGQVWVTGDTAGKVTINATGSGTVSIGRVFTTGGREQRLILAGTLGGPLSATANATMTPKTPQLPVTGASVTGALGGGLVLLVGGALGVMAVRRRRIRFTA